MGKQSAPAAPDPYATAGAQTQGNQQSAAYNAAINRMNTYTPYGSQQYSYQGADPNTGAPIYSQDIKFSPEQQALYNQQTGNEQKQGQISGNLLDNVSSTYSQPFSYDTNQGVQKAQDAIYARNTQYLDPQFTREQSQLETQLVNQGIPRDSEAWNNAMQSFNANKNQAYESARNDSISQSTGMSATQLQEALAARNQPLNEYNSLMSGSQAQLPQFNAPGGVSAQPADIAGAINNSYQGALAGYNAKQSSTNSLVGAGSTLLAAYLMSDRRTKENIEKIGKTDEGLNIYRYNYKGMMTPMIGVMAQEVEKDNPDAVIEIDGIKHVDYSLVN